MKVLLGWLLRIIATALALAGFVILAVMNTMGAGIAGVPTPWFGPFMWTVIPYVAGFLWAWWIQNLIQPRSWLVAAGFALLAAAGAYTDFIIFVAVVPLGFICIWIWRLGGRQIPPVKQKKRQRLRSLSRLGLPLSILLASLFLVVFGARWAGIYDVYYAATEAPPPGLKPGQLFITLDCCYSVTEGDLIVFGDGNENQVRRVVEILTDGSIRVAQPNGELIEVQANKLVGKVIYRFEKLTID